MIYSIDVTDPVLTCPANNLGINADANGEAIHNTGDAVCTDNSGDFTLSCDPIAASVGIGSITVNCRCDDAAGLTDQCSYTIEVIGEYTLQFGLNNSVSFSSDVK